VPKLPALEVLPIFRTAHQAELLRILLTQPDRKFKGVELAEMTRRPAPTTYKELNRLVGAGILEEEDVPPAKLYRAATDSPFYEHLRALVELALGPEAELRRRLANVDGVDVAAVFGSWARGTKIRPLSDVDVLVVGNALFEDLADAASEIEPLIGREIQIISYTWPELRERVTSDSGFATSVLNGPLTPLVGDLDKLRDASRG
jgi:predicted nucleotidyltransferase